MPINEKQITNEMIAKAMQCETADELIALANSEGIELTKEEAEAVNTIIKEVPNVVKNI